jgi:phenylalanyl-tRNA synthetase beta chain
MKLSFNWLKDHVDFDWSPAQLAERLLMAGIEVEGIESKGASFDRIVTAKILSVDKHPNADRLTVCRVTDGKVERQIVCGAKNHQPGDIVPLALPGCTLPAPLPDGKPFTIKESKLRGVDSQGMMCSPKELGLAEESQGLMLLPAETPVGVPFAQIVGGGDTVLDLEITPNRPDWLSVIGIAREVAALTGNPLKLPAIQLAPVNETAGATVRVDDPDLCPRYTARVIRSVHLGPSPKWMQERLEASGVRAINNIVDITNFVLLECGHPLHAFDRNLLAGRTIIVRRAAQGEGLRTIDGKVRTLTPDMLVIADAEKAVALAGIMGGAESEIHDKTVDVLLESAWFFPPNVRATSKKLGLKSESSYRFERGADIGICDWASRRAAALMAELAGGKVSSEAIDVYPQPASRRSVAVRYERTNQLLGVRVEPNRVQQMLTSLGLEIESSDATKATFSIPTFRVDLEREVDLIEEVCRIHGANNIPIVKPVAISGESPHDATYDFHARLRRLAAALGFDEATNYTLLGSSAEDGAFRLANPLSEDYAVLRGSLLPGLLASAAHNVGHKNPDLRLFELGRVFTAEGKERTTLGLLLTGKRHARHWEGGPPALLDVFDLKGAVEELLRQLGVEGWSVEKAATGATIRLGDRTLGTLGEVDPARTAKLKFPAPVVFAEVEVDALESSAPKTARYTRLPQFPAIVRDIAMVLDEFRTHQEVLDAIQHSYRAATKEKWLEQVEPFDIFRGGPIPAGRKSMAYSLTYRSPDRTLTDAEVNALHEKVRTGLKAKLGCEIRE